MQGYRPKALQRASLCPHLHVSHCCAPNEPPNTSNSCAAALCPHLNASHGGGPNDHLVGVPRIRNQLLGVPLRHALREEVGRCSSGSERQQRTRAIGCVVSRSGTPCGRKWKGRAQNQQ